MIPETHTDPTGTFENRIDETDETTCIEWYEVQDSQSYAAIYLVHDETGGDTLHSLCADELDEYTRFVDEPAEDQFLVWLSEK